MGDKKTETPSTAKKIIAIQHLYLQFQQLESLTFMKDGFVVGLQDETALILAGSLVVFGHWSTHH